MSEVKHYYCDICNKEVEEHWQMKNIVIYEKKYDRRSDLYDEYRADIDICKECEEKYKLTTYMTDYKEKGKFIKEIWRNIRKGKKKC